MSECEAIDAVKVHAAPNTYPELDDWELRQLLVRYVSDDDDYDDESVQRAVADAWAVKTGRVTDHHDASVNGRGLSASQVKAHCEERERFYRRQLPVHVA